jgi:hypothetical protein
MSPAARTPPTSSPRISKVRLRGVSHDAASPAIQIRAPVAPAAAVTAPAMHCAHMPSAYRARRAGDTHPGALVDTPRGY